MIVRRKLRHSYVIFVARRFHFINKLYNVIIYPQEPELRTTHHKPISIILNNRRFTVEMQFEINVLF